MWCRIVSLVSLLAFMVSGCFVDRTGLAGRDGSPSVPDAAGRDAMTTRVDGGRTDAGEDRDAGQPVVDAGPDVIDAGPPDAGPPDAGPPDAGPPDSGPPDSGPPDSGPPDGGPPDGGPPSCDTLYGSVRGYDLCEERPTECELFANPSGYDSCDNVCASAGGTCVAAYSEDWRNHCDRDGMHDCSDSNNDDICVCSRFHP